MIQTSAYDRKSLVERFTNSSCGPCASLNNLWYNVTSNNMVENRVISHIIYNVDWPQATDPMHLLNRVDNNTRRGFYAVSSVPWVEINGATFNTNLGSSSFTNTVTNANNQFSPFEIIINPERFSNDVIDVKITINRDISDITSFGNNVKLRVALTEKTVSYPFPPGSNGESSFYSVSRKMLPDGKGVLFEIPAPGASTELNFLYIPTADFLQKVNLDSLRIVAFIQNDDNKFIYQSEMTDIIFSNRINSAFNADENLGAIPLEVSFSDFSIGANSSNIVSWAWDFDNDGNTDSQEQNPTWVYNEVGQYTVKLTVSDGSEQHTRILSNYVETVTNSSNILVVNGIDFKTYPGEMTQFYNSSACFGNNQVDVWDLFGDQGFAYLNNSDILKTHLFNRDIPNSILHLYDKVIWIGNNYSGDLAFFNSAQVLEYLASGGHFLLATRMAANFFNTQLRNYAGISSVTGDLTSLELIAMDSNLVNMAGSTTNTLVHFVTLSSSSDAIPIFDDNSSTSWIAGFRMQKENEGAFIFIAGRPYRYNLASSFQNYDYIIENWMFTQPTNVDGEIQELIPVNYELSQNFPNPFNPSTKISYQLPMGNHTVLRVYDMLGNQIATLVDDYNTAGRHEVRFDASGLASGIYFYRLQSGNFIQSQKMLLIK